ncbi:hypothetical protein ABG067_007709, partial [Albugo candida]
MATTNSIEELQKHITEMKDNYNALRRDFDSLDSFIRENMVSQPAPAAQVLVGAQVRTTPKPRGVITARVITAELLSKMEVPNHEDAKKYYVAINAACQRSCKVYKTDHPLNKFKNWGDISPNEQQALCSSALADAVVAYPELEYLGRYAELWPFRSLIQPKWSSMACNARDKRERDQNRALQAATPAAPVAPAAP